MTMTNPTPPSSTPRPRALTPRLLSAALIIGGINAVLAIAVLVLHADTGRGGFALWLLGTLALATGLALFARAMTAQLPATPQAVPASTMPGAIAHRLLLRTNLETGKCACLAIGIDGFDQHASTHGPNIAEAMLAAVGGVFDAKLRASDIVGRAYDNIFVVVMPSTDPQGAQLTAQRIRDAALTGPFIPLPNGRTLKVTVSVGLSLLTDADSLESLLDRAHQTLQTAQQQGPATVLEG